MDGWGREREGGEKDEPDSLGCMLPGAARAVSWGMVTHVM